LEKQGLSAEEIAWRKTRLAQVVQSLKTYLPRTNLTNFNVTTYLSRLNATNAPVVGLAISGGGSQSGLGGLGLWQAFDERYAPAVRAGTGGLQQCLSYLTGLSGGGYLAVSSMSVLALPTHELALETHAPQRNQRLRNSLRHPQSDQLLD
jgi:lysophospholipase